MTKAPSPKSYQVTGLGNALVDILAPAEDRFLSENGIEKGMMRLIDRSDAAALYDKIGPAREVSGGSVANSIAILAHLGARSGFIGKLSADQLGQIFAHDLMAQGTIFRTPRLPVSSGAETGRCVSLVTPDGERSMSTYLGANLHFGADDLDEDLLAQSEWVFLEGYQFDSPQGRDAYTQAAGITHAAGGKIALTLSDPGCVARNHATFAHFVKSHVDAIFCNRKELLALYPGRDLDAALDVAAREVSLVVCTDGSRGAHLSQCNARHHIPVTPVTPKDATGAGDSYAGAFLWALTRGMDLPRCGEIAALVAAEIIATSGARPERDLRLLLEHAVPA